MSLRKRATRHTTHEEAEKLGDTLMQLPHFKEAFNTIRGTPLNKRKATVLLIGTKGTGKTYLANLLLTGLKVGYITTTQVGFLAEDCHGKDVIYWDEASIPAQEAELTKGIFQGRYYQIKRKGQSAQYQSEWTPVLATANLEPWVRERLKNDDCEALNDRCWRLDISADTLKGIDLELVDPIETLNYLHYKCQPEFSTEYEVQGRAYEEGEDTSTRNSQWTTYQRPHTQQPNAKRQRQK